METATLKKFAQFARRNLLEQVSAKLKLVLAENSAARRERAEASNNLEEKIKNHGIELVVERVAYIWFNRFCALRFMDVNRYTRIGIVSPAEGQFQPEYLADAKMGHIDEELVPDKIRQQIFALLDGKVLSRDPQSEAYRLLLVAACNFWHKAMPFLFQRIDDYTELLMPDDLLSGNSILAYTREAMTPDACQDVEVIGWLYQFYVSEKKGEVFADLKKNKKITPENIPAATQLFTPHWIVRYLVENSLGRLWLLNHPSSKLAEKMDYYIKPVKSGKWEVGSEKWKVESKENNDGSAKLSGIDHLAEGDGHGGNGLSRDEEFSQRGALRSDESGAPSSSVDSGQYSGGSGPKINSGIQELPFDSAGFKGGSGNTANDRSTFELSATTASRTDSESLRGDKTQDLLPDREAILTSHSPLPTSHLRISSPEEIRICDPACGSGHILTYAFDLLYAIYEEEGYEPTEIPAKILAHNLYGIEIDDRAGELAAFALTMKARAKQRRFFNKSVKPNICVLEKVDLTAKNAKNRKEDLFENQGHRDETELKSIIAALVQAGVAREALIHDLNLFAEADNFGSLLRPQLCSEQVQLALDALAAYDKSVQNPSFDYQELIDQCKQSLLQADYLSPKYHVVITNPPYMGGGGMNGRLGAWAKDNYPNSKSDLFAMFIERNLNLAQKYGAVAMITMQSWMFLSSFEKLRTKILAEATILSMAHLGARAFDSIGGEVVSTTAFVLENAHWPDYKGAYLRLVDGNSEAEKAKMLQEALK